MLGAALGGPPGGKEGATFGQVGEKLVVIWRQIGIK